MQKQESQENQEVIFIGEGAPQIRENKQSLPDVEIMQCVFLFHYTKNAYSSMLRGMLVRALCTLETKRMHDIFYSDDDSSTFSLYIQADSNDILAFANELSLILPLSLHFIFQEITALSSEEFQGIKARKDSGNLESIQQVGIEKSMLHAKLCAPNVKELHALLLSDNESYCDIARFVCLQTCSTLLIDNQLENKTTHYNTQAFLKDMLLPALTSFIMQHKTLPLQRNETRFILSLESKQDSNPFVLFSSLDSAQSYLRLDEAQKNMLASFEKPFVKAHCKEIFANELGSYAIFAGLSSDIIVLLLLTALQTQYGISYLFYTNLDSTDCDVASTHKSSAFDSKSTQEPLLIYTDSHPNTNLLESTYSVAGHIYISHDQTHKNLSSLLEQNKAEHARFVVFLSKTHDSLFLLQNPQNKENSLQEILHISFALSLYTHLQTLHGYTNGDRLLYNFAKQNGDIVTSWGLSKKQLELLGLDSVITQANDDEMPLRESKNLLDIGILIARILGLEGDIVFEANRCVRDRGPRIDYKLKRENDSIVLDYARLLRSVMSFQLAGVEKELLCFGVIDSLAEFIGTLAGDMLLNYGIQEVFVCGDMLLEQCFLERIVKALPQNMRASFPQHGGTDYLE